MYIDTDTGHDTHIYTDHDADTYQLMWSDHDDSIDTENENWYWYQSSDDVDGTYVYIDK